MSDHIHVIDPASPVEDNVVVEGYGEGGNELPAEAVTTPACWAKRAIDKNGKLTRYFILRVNYGLDKGNFYNPASSIGVTPASQPRAGQDATSFVSVSAQAFDHYLHFLRTGNPAHLRMAMRA